MQVSDCLNYYIVTDSSDEGNINNLDDDCELVHGNVEEKNGDELLIDLYKERPFLYDKNNPSSKDYLMRQNAWIEISKIMIQANCGDIYTPSYCKKRCSSLRDQYTRKKRVEFKSKSAAAKAQFSLSSRLTFLDNVIKRRHFTKAKSQLSVVDEDNNIYESQNNIANESSNEENKSVNKQHIYNTKKSNKKNNRIKLGKRKVNETKELEPPVVQRSQKKKVNETKELEPPVVQMSQKQKVNETKELEQPIVQISSNKTSTYTEKKDSTADDAFMEFLKVLFNNIPEKEKNIRRKLIMDVMTTPLSQEIQQKDCKCNSL